MPGFGILALCGSDPCGVARQAALSDGFGGAETGSCTASNPRGPSPVPCDVMQRRSRLLG